MRSPYVKSVRKIRLFEFLLFKLSKMFTLIYAVLVHSPLIPICDRNSGVSPQNHAGMVAVLVVQFDLYSNLVNLVDFLLERVHSSLSLAQIGCAKTKAQRKKRFYLIYQLDECRSHSSNEMVKTKSNDQTTIWIPDYFFFASKCNF